MSDDALPPERRQNAGGQPRPDQPARRQGDQKFKLSVQGGAGQDVEGRHSEQQGPESGRVVEFTTPRAKLIEEASLAIRGKAPDPATIGEFAEALGSTGPCAKPRLVPGNVKQYNRFELMEFALNCPLTLPGGGKS